jgi:hypothetical protein
MAQIFDGGPALSQKEKREATLNAAHMLNQLRGIIDEHCPDQWTARMENDFWRFIRALPRDDRTSVIN